jgi:hypothetical protein
VEVDEVEAYQYSRSCWVCHTFSGHAFVCVVASPSFCLFSIPPCALHCYHTSLLSLCTVIAQHCCYSALLSHLTVITLHCYHTSRTRHSLAWFLSAFLSFSRVGRLEGRGISAVGTPCPRCSCSGQSSGAANISGASLST